MSYSGDSLLILPCIFRLVDIISKLNLQKASVSRHMALVIQPILEKGIVDHSILHKVLMEYFSIADKVGLRKLICIGTCLSSKLFWCFQASTFWILVVHSSQLQMWFNNCQVLFLFEWSIQGMDLKLECFVLSMEVQRFVLSGVRIVNFQYK